MLVQNGENQQSQCIPDQRDNVISWLKGEFAAANAIIDALCQHLQTVGEPSEYDLVLTRIQQRRYNWTAVLYMQQYVSIAEVMFALQQVAGRKQQRNSDHFSGAEINCEFNEKDNASSWTEIHGGANHRCASEGVSYPTESVKKSGHQISFSRKGSKDRGNSSGQSYDYKREIVGTNSALHPVEGHGNLLGYGTGEDEKNASSLLSSALSGKLKQGDGANRDGEERLGSGNTRPNGTEEHGEVQEDSIQEVPEEAVEHAMVTEAIGQGRDCTHGNRQKSEPKLTEFEQLLKNKTLSREEFNHLTELLQSRIVDSSSGLKDYEEQMRGELRGGVEPNNVANANAQKWCDERRKARQEKENVVWDNSLMGNTASLAMPPSNLGAPPFIDIHGSSSSPVQTHNQSLGQGISATDQNYTANVFVRVDADSAVLDIPSSALEKSKGFRMSALEISQEESDEEDHGDRKSPVSVHGETGKFTSVESDGSDGDVNSLKADKPIQTLFVGKASAGTELSTRTEFSGAQSTFTPSGTLAFSGGGFCFRVEGEKSAHKFMRAKGFKSSRK